MTHEEKDLLLKDLCARAPYSVKCQCYDGRLTATLTGVKSETELYFHEFDWKEDDGIIEIEFCKPYLFPMSSMTEEQKYELHFFGFYLLENDETNKLEIINYIDEYAMPYGDCNHQNCYELIDWLNKHHIDYRGLIDKGLAIDATDLNIY